MAILHLELLHCIQSYFKRDIKTGELHKSTSRMIKDIAVSSAWRMIMLGHCMLDQWCPRWDMIMIHRIVSGMVRLERVQRLKSLRALQEGRRNHPQNKYNYVLHAKSSWDVELLSEVHCRCLSCMAWRVIGQEKLSGYKVCKQKTAEDRGGGLFAIYYACIWFYPCLKLDT